MSLFECNLHAIPEGSDSASRLAFAAKRLGYEGIIISNHSFFNDIFRPRAAFKVKGIDVAFGIEIVANNSKALRNCISIMRAKYAFIAIHGGSEDINRAACEHPEVDVLLHPEEGKRVLSIAAARSAEQNQVAVGFDLSPLIRLRGITRARRLELIKRNIILARKFNLQIMITTSARSRFDLRTPQELRALAEIAGFEKYETEAALNLPGKILELNKRTWLSTGVELL
jgi:ribonuclease P/MRP protein subunit RPP1